MRGPRPCLATPCRGLPRTGTASGQSGPARQGGTEPLAAGTTAMVTRRVGPGYPDGLDGPVHSAVQAAWHSEGHQLTFACDGFPGGTSESPWIINGTAVHGLIGGFHQGGDTPAVSYSPFSGVNVRALYHTASETFV
jgi:hypothetical protein